VQSFAQFVFVSLFSLAGIVSRQRDVDVYRVGRTDNMYWFPLYGRRWSRGL